MAHGPWAMVATEAAMASTTPWWPRKPHGNGKKAAHAADSAAQVAEGAQACAEPGTRMPPGRVGDRQPASGRITDRDRTTDPTAAGRSATATAIPAVAAVVASPAAPLTQTRRPPS